MLDMEGNFESTTAAPEGESDALERAEAKRVEILGAIDEQQAAFVKGPDGRMVDYESDKDAAARRDDLKRLRAEYLAVLDDELTAHRLAGSEGDGHVADGIGAGAESWTFMNGAIDELTRRVGKLRKDEVVPEMRFSEEEAQDIINLKDAALPGNAGERVRALERMPLFDLNRLDDAGFARLKSWTERQLSALTETDRRMKGVEEAESNVRAAMLAEERRRKKG